MAGQAFIRKGDQEKIRYAVHRQNPKCTTANYQRAFKRTPLDEKKQKKKKAKAVLRGKANECGCKAQPLYESHEATKSGKTRAKAKKAYSRPSLFVSTLKAGNQQRRPR